MAGGQFRIFVAHSCLTRRYSFIADCLKEVWQTSCRSLTAANLRNVEPLTTDKLLGRRLNLKEER
eukprot:2552206-Amphidinium_carterae.1